jgi:threonine dehydratase
MPLYIENITMNDLNIPSVREIQSARSQLGKRVRFTPVWEWKSEQKDEIYGRETSLLMKLELLQFGGSFKCRGSLMNILSLSHEQLEKGVTAVSAGNHAISVAFAAKTVGTSAKVVMPKTANKVRVNLCKSLGAEVVLAEDVHHAFERVEMIEEQEGRFFIHPFDGFNTILGTATVGLELSEQADDLDAVIVPVGGGGLIAGISCCIKQLNPDIQVFGVEPEGADSMSQSFASGKPQSVEKIHTIADSLGAPFALPYSFGISYQFVDEMVTVNDVQMASTMKLLFEELKLAVEPAAASAMAALRYSLLEKLQGKRVGIIVCGSNIDVETFYKNIALSVDD